MILSDVTINKYIDSGKIKILPEFDKSDIRPNGIRLHLGDEILIPIGNQVVDISMPVDVEYKKIKIPEEGFLLKAGMFVLSSTYENIMTSRNIVSHLEGRSTVARLGLSIHCTSGIIDGNYDEPRSIVFELKNNGNFDIILRSRVPLGMLIFSELSDFIQQQSQSQYRGQNSVLPPNLKVQKR